MTAIFRITLTQNNLWLSAAIPLYTWWSILCVFRHCQLSLLVTICRWWHVLVKVQPFVLSGTCVRGFISSPLYSPQMLEVFFIVFSCLFSCSCMESVRLLRKVFTARLQISRGERRTLWWYVARTFPPLHLKKWCLSLRSSCLESLNSLLIFTRK